MSLDEALRPMEMTCADCGGKMTAYPDEGTGKGYCPNCSPAWLKPFAIFSMNQMRIKHELGEIQGDTHDT
jgi:hypothetical protein